MGLIVAANWKMFKNNKETVEYFDGLKKFEDEFSEVKIVVCPPFTALFKAGEALEGSAYELGAQNLFWENEGAFTGEISPAMLKDNGAKYVLIGHSERRWVMGETDEDINKKMKNAFDNNLIPIFCVGEKIEERKSGDTDKVILDQLRKGLKDIDPKLDEKMIIAYEPVWAIGTGMAATAEDAVAVIDGCILKEMNSRSSTGKSPVPVLYGGSVKEDNIGDFVSRECISGALVGGASLKADSFAALIRAAKKSYA